MNVLDKINLNECFGCASCDKKCPTSAISMVQNEEGFVYPNIDIYKCIHCEKCMKHCPLITNKNHTNQIKNTVILILKNIDILNKSSSGGGFAGLASEVIKEGGVVYGCIYDEKLNAIQKRCVSLNELGLFQGSKYVFSSTQNTFLEVEQDLKAGRQVIYCGRPCQIAGLKSYLAKEYENLYLLDLVCHGVPSQKLFTKYINWLQMKYKGIVTYYSFRDKRNGGWSADGLCVIKKKNKYITKKIYSIIDPYYSSFKKNETFRESCYICPYSSQQRVGDLSLCDFWGVKKYFQNINAARGVSACLANTEKGEKILNKYINLFDSYECDLDKVVKHNRNLRKPSSRPLERDYIYKEIDKSDLNTYFNKFGKKSIFNLFAYKCKGFIAKHMPEKIKSLIRSLKND